MTKEKVCICEQHYSSKDDTAPAIQSIDDGNHTSPAFSSPFLTPASTSLLNVSIMYSSPPHLCADPLSVLSAAAGRGRMEMCVVLLERGASLEPPNRRGMVPLICATKHGHTQVGTENVRHLKCLKKQLVFVESFKCVTALNTTITSGCGC